MPTAGPTISPSIPDAVYRIHIDNTGNGTESLTFQFRFGEALRDIQLPVGGKNVSIPLINAGPIVGNFDPTVNRAESYTVRVIRGAVDGNTRPGLRPERHQRRRRAPPGSTSRSTTSARRPSPTMRPTPATSSIPSASRVAAAPGKVFVGQRKDPFSVNLGEIFDLVNIDNPIGSRNSEADSLADKNITSIIMEVPPPA